VVFCYSFSFRNIRAETKSCPIIQNTNYELYPTSKNLSEFLVVLTRGLDASLQFGISTFATKNIDDFKKITEIHLIPL